MNKNERQQAIHDEMERRAALCGIPPERHVYKIGNHHSDEGGPRTFVPVEEVRRLDADNDDRTLWPALMARAMEDGEPIELEPDNCRVFRDGRTPLADICSWGHGGDCLLILTERAHGVLAPLLENVCRPVPVHCATARLFGYCPTAVEDVLDAAHSQGSGLKQFAFFTERLGRAVLFRTAQIDYHIYALQPLVSVAQEQKLTGFRYELVWPQLPMPRVVTVEVKKRPRSASEKLRLPRFSNKAQELKSDLLGDLLGTPLTSDEDGPFNLVTYRLPDLAVPSGSIVAADLVLSQGKPFVRKVKPGHYPLTLVAARLANNDERIAFAIIHFAKGRIARWENAAIEGAASEKGHHVEPHCYGVDSGNGGFCDAGAQELLLNLADPESTLEKHIEQEMAKAYRHTRHWVHMETDRGSAAVFSAGYGDGAYPSYFGVDAAGEPLALMTDFGVLDWPRDPAVAGNMH